MASRRRPAKRLSEAPRPVAEPAPAQEVIEGWDAIESMRLVLEERLAELELQLEDTGWIRQAAYTERDFTRDGLRRICRQARLYFLKNPLINHGVHLQANYVFG